MILSGLSRSKINWGLHFSLNEGYSAYLGDEINGFKARGTGFPTLIEATEWLSDQTFTHYPESDYVKNLSVTHII